MLKFESIRHHTGVLSTAEGPKDIYTFTYLVRKGNREISFTQYELDKIYKEMREYYKKETVTE